MDKAIEAKIIERIMKDETLKKQVMAMDAKAAQAFLIKQGLAKVSEEEAGKLLGKMKKFLADGALTDEELEKVAGGSDVDAPIQLVRKVRKVITEEISASSCS